VVLREIDALGRAVEEAWSRVDYDPRSFPRLCAEQLDAARLHERIGLDDLVRAALARDLPQQSDPAAQFGQPPVTLFRSRRFYIDALFWVDSTTAVHDHGFSGAFQVLAGSSIETTYSFRLLRDVDGHLKTGELRVERSALRRAGDARPIVAGPQFIHALFHLDRPSISLVVRTYSDPGVAIQLQYSPSGLAFDSFEEDQVRTRAVQLVAMLRKIDHPRFEEIVGDSIARADPGTAFAIIRSCVSAPDVLLESLVARVRSADLADRIRSWVQHRKHIEFIASKREFVRDPALRFMLAVLLNVQTRADALRLAREYAPSEDPAAQLARWLGELSRTTAKLIVAGAPFEPNLLGLPRFDDAHERCVADLLSGRQPEPAAYRGADTLAFLERLRALPYLAALFR
jgi:hypothetical protein